MKSPKEGEGQGVGERGVLGRVKGVGEGGSEPVSFSVIPTHSSLPLKFCQVSTFQSSNL